MRAVAVRVGRVAVATDVVMPKRWVDVRREVLVRRRDPGVDDGDLDAAAAGLDVPGRGGIDLCEPPERSVLRVVRRGEGVLAVVRTCVADQGIGPEGGHGRGNGLTPGDADELEARKAQLPDRGRTVLGERLPAA